MDLTALKNGKKEQESEMFIKSMLSSLFKREYDKCLTFTQEAQKFFLKERAPESLSLCLSIIGLINYIKDSKKYVNTLVQLNDAKFLADSLRSKTAKAINEFAFAEIEYRENNLKESFIHYQNAEKFAQVNDEYNILTNIIAEKTKLNGPQLLRQKRDPLMALLKISQAVTAQTDLDMLLKVIAEETKAAIQADRCTVFLYDKENKELWSKVALGMERQEIRFPVRKGLAGHVVLTGETINIKDAYSDSRFNPEIDNQTGYKTRTILCMPIKNLKQEIIGAFQVLNKIDGVFNEEDEDLLVAIGSTAGVALENAGLFKKQQEMFTEQKLIFDSFIDTLATSIDARDKITAGHSSRVRLYSGLIARELGLDDKSVEIIETAATLHDIGKIGIRDSVLQKEGKLTDEEYKHIQEHVEITHNILEKIHMTDDFKQVTEIACSHHEKYDGSGYYRHLKGDDIILGGRILAVSDVFDAITSKRHYRDKMPIANVIKILINDSGTHFDKPLVNCFLSISADKVVKVFLTENKLVMKPEDEEVLAQYNLRKLYELLTSDAELSIEDKKFTELFQFYYTAKTDEGSKINA